MASTDAAPGIDARFAQVDGRFAQIDGRFAVIDVRLDNLDRRLGESEKRSDTKMDARLAGLEHRMTMRLGGIMVTGLGVFATLIKLL